MSCSLVIFCACVSESEPPKTVKSLAKTKTARPLTVPQPVTTPSPEIFSPWSMPKSVQRCVDEHVEFFERAVIEQQLDALARRELAARVLRFDALLAAAEPRGRAALFEPVENMFHVPALVADYGCASGASRACATQAASGRCRRRSACKADRATCARRASRVRCSRPSSPRSGQASARMPPSS